MPITINHLTLEIFVVQICILLGFAFTAPTFYVARTEDLFDVVGFGTTHQFSGDICKFDVSSCEEPRLCRDAQLKSCTAESTFCICLQQGFTQCSSSTTCLPGDRCATTLLSTGPTNLCISCNVIAENTNFSPVDDGVDRCPMTPSPTPLQSINTATTPMLTIEMSPSVEATEYSDAEPTSSAVYTAPSPQSTTLTTPNTPQPSTVISTPSGSYSTPKASASVSLMSDDPVMSQSPWTSTNPSDGDYNDGNSTNSPTDEDMGLNGTGTGVSPSNNVSIDSNDTDTTVGGGNDTNNTGTDSQPSDNEGGNKSPTETTVSPDQETSSGGSDNESGTGTSAGGDGETPDSGNDGTNTTDTSGEEIKSTMSPSINPGDNTTTTGSENSTGDNTAQGEGSSTIGTDSTGGDAVNGDDDTPSTVQASISPDGDGVYPDEESDPVVEDNDPQPSSNSTTNICIAIDSLKHLPGIKYVFKSAKRAVVLCDNSETCATPSHIVIYKGQVLTMKDYCGFVDGGCTRKVKLVNSPKMESGLRLLSRQKHLVFTAFAAQFNTRIEKLFFKGIVKLGL